MLHIYVVLANAILFFIDVKIKEFATQQRQNTHMYVATYESSITEQ